ncbi:hypothetical protein A359_05220 [secondary endosymbiont of Ctenarytaina eucalypti]|uniref:Uncharacterized protein n=1 Tax=secondary endosymbiont of Ctenarytaina eucalypti TaxID=1199245 RepID=J3Z3W1_9ENTR|nr:hypothetical protein A359_05220 [secondary endosymbiont of Ctenarytaina eucalypti]
MRHSYNICIIPIQALCNFCFTEIVTVKRRSETPIWTDSVSFFMQKYLLALVACPMLSPSHSCKITFFIITVNRVAKHQTYF